MTKKALVLGITGQDGSYLSELLLSKGYEVHGVIRRSSLPNTGRIDDFFDPESKQFIHYGDLSEGIDHLLIDIQPDEIYNLAAMSHVRISFDVPVYTLDVNSTGVCRILEGIRKICPNAKYYQASSSEMFGVTPPPQNEETIFHPVSPYGCAKLSAYWLTRCYRDGYNMFASNGILFNHESPRRGVNFVTRKITRLACRIKLGLQEKIELGNLEAIRDWGHSKDYMRAIHMILQHTEPDDFVVSTGEAHSVREFAEKVFNSLGLDFYKHLVSNDSYKRPVEVPYLLGDPSKIQKVLGWKPEVSFEELVNDMVSHDMKEVENEIKLNSRG
jgi:GDPmannose 4,6-dehydratase